nr:hypothetical protein [Lachnospiraceae bacterium]
NASDEDGEFGFDMEELEGFSAGSDARELWSGESVRIGDTFTATLPAHSAKVFYIA